MPQKPDPFAQFKQYEVPKVDPFAEFAQYEVGKEVMTPAAPKGNKVQQWMDELARMLKDPASPVSNAMRNMPGPQGWLSAPARHLAADNIEVLAHPVENAPTLAAMAATGGVGGALARTGMAAARPIVSAGLRTLAAGAGGATGGAISGQDPTVSGVLQAGLQGAIDVPMSALAGPFKRLSRGITTAALNPSREVLDQLRDPVTGKQFGNYELAAKHFGERALSIQPTGTPGRSTYQQGLRGQLDAAQDQKQQVYRAFGDRRIPTEELAPEGMADTVAERIIARGTGDADAALAKMSQTINTALDRSELLRGAPGAPLARRAGSNVPIADGPARPESMSVQQVDQLQKGLQDELTKFKAQEAGALMSGVNIPVEREMEMEAKDLLRRSASDATARHTLPDLIKRLNAEISERLPYERAALEATLPGGGSNIPRARISTGGGNVPLRFQIFDYLGGKSRPFARPLLAASHGAPKVGEWSPQLLRALGLMASGGEK